jgi:hypothetical protein
MRRKLWLAAVVWMGCGCQHPRDPLPAFPGLVLWAWERPERLDFLNPQSAGVAFLARTVSWRAGQIASRPRLQPFRAPPRTALMAVVRLESGGWPLPAAGAAVSQIMKAASIPGVQAMQVDFDARLSERDWYRQVLVELRRELKPSLPLSITALASWCGRESWLDGLPINDAVPMLFRMGAGEPKGVRDFPAGVCRSSFGISTDELPANLPHGRRLFVFNPRAWDEDAYRGTVRLAAKWR